MIISKVRHGASRATRIPASIFPSCSPPVTPPYLCHTVSSKTEPTITEIPLPSVTSRLLWSWFSLPGIFLSFSLLAWVWMSPHPHAPVKLARQCRDRDISSRPFGPIDTSSAVGWPLWAHCNPDVPWDPQRELLLHLIITVPVNNSSTDTSLQNEHMHIWSV